MALNCLPRKALEKTSHRLQISCSEKLEEGLDEAVWAVVPVSKGPRLAELDEALSNKVVMNRAVEQIDECRTRRIVLPPLRRDEEAEVAELREDVAIESVGDPSAYLPNVGNGGWVIWPEVGLHVISVDYIAVGLYGKSAIYDNQRIPN
jgi:hypothetical protein